jgi:hypothetical protein
MAFLAMICPDKDNLQNNMHEKALENYEQHLNHRSTLSWPIFLSGLFLKTFHFLFYGQQI